MLVGKLPQINQVLASRTTQQPAPSQLYDDLQEDQSDFQPRFSIYTVKFVH